MEGMGILMKELLENYNLLFILMALSGVAVLFQAGSFVLYHRLLWDSNQMGTTDNKWMRSMMSKFEAYYKLRISVHNVENFVDRYLYHYHFLGMSLQAWENIGHFFMSVLVAGAGLLCLAGGYYHLPGSWFWVTGIVTLLLLCVQGVAGMIFNTHKCWCVLRIQVIDYMENTMRARLENEYFHQEETAQYRMDYFVPASGESEQGVSAAQGESLQEANQEGVAATLEKRAAALPEFRELLNSFLEEMQLDRNISQKQKALSEHTAKERAQLFEEILEEYM